MSTELEKYLERSRQELDVEYPDDKRIWDNITKEIRKKKRLPYVKRSARIIPLRIRNIAAVVVIMLSLGYIANDLIQDNLFNNRVTLSSVDTILGNREQEYITQVSFKEKEIRSFDSPQNEIIKELFRELKYLDEIYKESMEDLKELGNDDQVINTIFNTYERKIQLLELIIIETNKIRNDEKNDQAAL